MSEMISKPDANPVITVLAAWFLPGLGHILIGQQSKGIKILIGTFLIAFFTCGLGYMLNFAWMFDSFKLAQKLQEGASIGENENALGFLDSIFKD